MIRVRVRILKVRIRYFTSGQYHRNWFWGGSSLVHWAQPKGLDCVSCFDHCCVYLESMPNVECLAQVPTQRFAICNRCGTRPYVIALRRRTYFHFYLPTSYPCVILWLCSSYQQGSNVSGNRLSEHYNYSYTCLSVWNNLLSGVLTSAFQSPFQGNDTFCGP